MPIIAHIGPDGSGKTYGMAMDAETIFLQEQKKRPEHRKEMWSLTPMAHCQLLAEPLQAIYLRNSIIFWPELQRWYPAGNYDLDEITQHIISTHRHDRNVIHWDSQAWEYVHHFIRYETTKVWRYEALHRDVLTGESNWWRTGLKRHVRDLWDATDVQLKHRTGRLKTQYFFITKKGIDRYNSFDKMQVIRRKNITNRDTADIVDPHLMADVPASGDDVEYEQKDPCRDEQALNQEEKTEDGDNLVEREEESDEGDSSVHLPYPAIPSGR
jgi:hypothetical protein